MSLHPEDKARLDKIKDERRAWRKIVVEAMILSVDFNNVKNDPQVILCLVEAGFSLGDIRENWDELKARRQH